MGEKDGEILRKDLGRIWTSSMVQMHGCWSVTQKAGWKLIDEEKKRIETSTSRCTITSQCTYYLTLKL